MYSLLAGRLQSCILAIVFCSIGWPIYVLIKTVCGMSISALRDSMLPEYDVSRLSLKADSECR